jgi:hypothetical protein
MEYTVNPTCDSHAMKILLVVVVVALIIWMIYPYFKQKGSSESFKSCMKVVSNEPTVYEQREPPMIEPPSYDSDTMAIQSGSDYIPQKQYFTPWGTIMKVGDVLSSDGEPVFSDASLANNTMNFNQCSPSCCSDQWPVPFKMPVDKTLCGSKDEFVPTSYYCNNGWQDSGCLCMTKKQSDFLQTRGSNTDY